MGDDLCWQSARSMGEAVGRREVSPVELVEAHLARIEQVDRRYNAFITVMAEDARRDARRAEQEVLAGRPRGPLHGVPAAVKDLIWTRNVRTTAGSQVLAHFVPDEDATVVARLRAAGAVVVGKTNLHEFAFGVTGANPHYGPTRNPWDTGRIAGGSSGGSAAATSAGLCPISIGTDTGGSIRVPAALCGVVGLKPTYGRVSRHGVVTLAWSMDHVGPIARTVEDAALLMNAIAGYDPLDPASARVPVPDYTAGLNGEVRGLRAGLLKESFQEPMEEDVRRLVLAAAGVLEEAGMVVEEVSIPETMLAPPVSTTILFSEASAYHDAWLRARAHEYGPDVRERLELGKLFLATEYLQAQRARAAINGAVARALERVDVLLLPTVPVEAPLLGQQTVRPGDGEEEVQAALVRFTRLFNITGSPVVSVPCGTTSAGLPAGLQIAGRPWEEGTVLRVAYAYEVRTPWHGGRAAA